MSEALCGREGRRNSGQILPISTPVLAHFFEYSLDLEGKVEQSSDKQLRQFPRLTEPPPPTSGNSFSHWINGAVCGNLPKLLRTEMRYSMRYFEQNLQLSAFFWGHLEISTNGKKGLF